MTRELAALLHDKSGSTAIEYGLLLTCIALIAAIGLSLLGNAISGMFMTTVGLIGG